jgi:hypothetical protein
MLPLLNIAARVGFSAINGRVGTDTLRLTDADRRVQAMVWCGIIALLALSRLGSVAFGWVDALWSSGTILREANIQRM